LLFDIKPHHLEANKMPIRFNQIFFLFLLFTALPTTVLADKVIVVTENYPPYNYEHEGKVSGLSTDIVKRIIKISIKSRLTACRRASYIRQKNLLGQVTTRFV
jgi:hypothetical protein